MDYVEKFLLDSKMRPSTLGFFYFIDAVHYAEKGKTNMTEIYEKIAMKYKTNPLTVERHIRNIKNKICGKASKHMGNKEAVLSMARYKTLAIIK